MGTAKTIATVGLRVVALWIFLGAILDLGSDLLRTGHDHAVVSEANPIIAPSFDRSPHPAARHTVPWPMMGPLALRFGAGLVLLILSKPIGGLLAWRIETARAGEAKAKEF